MAKLKLDARPVVKVDMRAYQQQVMAALQTLPREGADRSTVSFVVSQVRAERTPKFNNGLSAVKALVNESLKQPRIGPFERPDPYA